ncbi:hypothetical protein FDH29_gp27 [Aquamicrobium phage P14]|uniref:Uncharacterized protein n=1 Tax=Aquamicrobium phage P14 TaxID=1927013 RepID=A0A1L5C058_9CAUD|nr:hypothetical protein FDH29_gp27 [Aquamicrobium phage P14]APL99485.1 hypothetical protein BB738_0270 [Aquamicrobium phage P14]
MILDSIISKIVEDNTKFTTYNEDLDNRVYLSASLLFPGFPKLTVVRTVSCLEIQSRRCWSLWEDEIRSQLAEQLKAEIKARVIKELECNHVPS